MQTAAIDGYITKKDAAERYDRSHRSITRDLTTAIRVGDHRILRNVKIVTDEGEILDGADVTLESIQEMSNQGLRPTWYLSQLWADDYYSAGSAKRTTEQNTTTKEDEVQSASDEIYEDIPDDVEALKRENRRLQQQNNDLRDDKTHLREELKANNQRWGETNVLMKGLHEFLTAQGFLSSQFMIPPDSGSKQLAAPESSPSAEPKKQPEETSPVIDVPAEQTPAAAPEKGSDGRRTQKSRSTKGTSQTRKKKTVTKKRKKASKPKSTASKHTQARKRKTTKKAGSKRSRPAPKGLGGLLSRFLSH